MTKIMTNFMTFERKKDENRRQINFYPNRENP